MKVTLKHGKRKIKNVVIEDDSFEDFQAKIFSLTQVPPERQKIVCKGKRIESDSDLKIIKNKAVVLLMGSADTSVSAVGADGSAITFVEDMTAGQRQEANAELPPGLENLGNTCYLNSTLQAIKAVPEMKEALKKQESMNPTLSSEMGTLFRQMDSCSDSVEPRDFVSFFRQRFPRFANRNDAGVWEQQDADECYTEIMNCLRNEMRIENNENWVDSLFGGTLDVTLECKESTEEPIVTGNETFDRLRCFIDTETRHINDGIVKSMCEPLEKNSVKLARNAMWEKKTAISKLPQYLTINMVRFFWKAKQQKNAKVLRSVIFPEKLDVYEFCNAELKTQIGKYRKLMLEKEDSEREKRQATKVDAQPETEAEEKKEADDQMDVDSAADKTRLETGYYELIALVTHKGLSSNSGHYIGYVKDDKRGWLKFDDETVSEVSSDEIKKLYGGGQWQMGFLCVYKNTKPTIE